jgi:hypothetical protein
VKDVIKLALARNGAISSMWMLTLYIKSASTLKKQPRFWPRHKVDDAGFVPSQFQDIT